MPDHGHVRNHVPVTNILLPTTDGGVIAQVVIVTIGFAVVTWALRRKPDLRLLAIGLWLTTYGAIGVRSLH